MLDTLPEPTQRGAQRLAGVDIQKPRLWAVMEAVLALAPKPEGYTAQEVAAKVRGKTLAERVSFSRRYWPPVPGIQMLTVLLILREEVIKPVLAGVCTHERGPKPKRTHPLDLRGYFLVTHTQKALTRDMISDQMYNVGLFLLQMNVSPRRPTWA